MSKARLSRVCEEAAPAQRSAAAVHERPGTAAADQGDLPPALRAGIEALSGVSLNAVQVHYNSARPAQLAAEAYASGDQIHLAPGHEQHLPHEAWHLVQQRQGRVRPTLRLPGGLVNDDPQLEQEADQMGTQALQAGPRMVAQRQQLQRLETSAASSGRGRGPRPWVTQRWPVGDAGWLEVLGTLLGLLIAWYVLGGRFPGTRYGTRARQVEPPSSTTEVPSGVDSGAVAQATDLLEQQAQADESLRDSLSRATHGADQDTAAEQLHSIPQVQQVLHQVVLPSLEGAEEPSSPLPSNAVQVPLTLEEKIPPSQSEGLASEVLPVSAPPEAISGQEIATDQGARSVVGESTKTPAFVPKRKAKRYGKTSRKKTQAQIPSASSVQDESHPPERKTSLSRAQVRQLVKLGVDSEDGEALFDWLGSDKDAWEAFTHDKAAFDIGLTLASSSAKYFELAAFVEHERKTEKELPYVDAAATFLQLRASPASSSQERKATVKREPNTLSHIERHWKGFLSGYEGGGGLSVVKEEHEDHGKVVHSKSGSGMPLFKGLLVELGERGGQQRAHISLSPGEEGFFEEGHLKIEGGPLLNQYFFLVDERGVHQLGNSRAVPTGKPGKWSDLPSSVWSQVRSIVSQLYSGELGVNANL